ncbi:hypothetical protein [Spongiibacter tropicus]|uniref:hypothetical protein n=1 Tax=Spongiibacter tropicus TaxID=454602 RepID=UPI0035BE5E01
MDTENDQNHDSSLDDEHIANRRKSLAALDLSQVSKKPRKDQGKRRLSHALGHLMSEPLPEQRLCSRCRRELTEEKERR